MTSDAFSPSVGSLLPLHASKSPIAYNQAPPTLIESYKINKNAAKQRSSSSDEYQRMKDAPKEALKLYHTLINASLMKIFRYRKDPSIKKLNLIPYNMAGTVESATFDDIIASVNRTLDTSIAKLSDELSKEYQTLVTKVKSLEDLPKEAKYKQYLESLYELQMIKNVTPYFNPNSGEVCFLNFKLVETSFDGSVSPSKTHDYQFPPETMKKNENPDFEATLFKFHDKWFLETLFIHPEKSLQFNLKDRGLGYKADYLLLRLDIDTAKVAKMNDKLVLASFFGYTSLSKFQTKYEILYTSSLEVTKSIDDVVSAKLYYILKLSAKDRLPTKSSTNYPFAKLNVLNDVKYCYFCKSRNHTILQCPNVVP